MNPAGVKSIKPVGSTRTPPGGINLTRQDLHVSVSAKPEVKLG